MRWWKLLLSAHIFFPSPVWCQNVRAPHTMSGHAPWTHVMSRRVSRCQPSKPPSAHVEEAQAGGPISSTTEARIWRGVKALEGEVLEPKMYFDPPYMNEKYLSDIVRDGSIRVPC